MKYSEKQVFTDSRVNAIIDRVLFEVNQTGKAPDSYIFLTGRAAAILQGEDNVPCNNVILITADEEVFAFVQDVLPKIINHKGVIRFRERVLYEFESFKLEIWLSESAITTTGVDSIWMQTLATINEILL